jgi:sucrose phosphorylase
MARAIQMFMPGIPQVWYLDLFAGTNDYAAADQGGAAGHKEINRTNLSWEQVEQGLTRQVVLDQLCLMRLRNSCPAFHGEMEMGDTPDHLLELTWRKGGDAVTLHADLRDLSLRISRTGDTCSDICMPTAPPPAADGPAAETHPS